MHTTSLTPAEMAERTGVTIDTLRYYENEGLLTNIARADSGHRRYSDDDALWVEVEAKIEQRHAALRLIDHKLSFYADHDTKESS